jgi:hypothetical protein
MSVNQRIFLYGNSVILGSIGASLRRCSQFDVTTIATPLQEALSFDAPKPDILLFDLEAPYTEDVFFLMKTKPELLLIGISPSINFVQVCHCQQIEGISMHGLIELIKNIQP